MCSSNWIIMKYTRFFLVLSVAFCYTGLCDDVAHSHTLPNITNCHTNQQNEISSNKAMANSYKITDSIKHQICKICICDYTLPNAPNVYDFSLKGILYSVAVNIPVLGINKVPSSPLSLEIKREYQPPELFLANSSFLL